MADTQDCSACDGTGWNKGPLVAGLGRGVCLRCNGTRRQPAPPAGAPTDDRSGRSLHQVRVQVHETLRGEGYQPEGTTVPIDPPLAPPPRSALIWRHPATGHSVVVLYTERETLVYSLVESVNGRALRGLGPS